MSGSFDDEGRSRHADAGQADDSISDGQSADDQADRDSQGCEQDREDAAVKEESVLHEGLQ
jgi:hypothetical protein